MRERDEKFDDTKIWGVVCINYGDVILKANFIVVNVMIV